MAGVLELAQLLQHDRVAEVEVGRGRVQAELDAQRAAAREALLERARGQAVDRVARQVRRRLGGLGGGSIHPAPMLASPRGPRSAPAGASPDEAPEEPSGAGARGGSAPPHERSRAHQPIRPPPAPDGPRGPATARPSSAALRPARPSRRRAARARRRADGGATSASASCGCSLLLVGLGMLAAVSTVFGMMMAVASDLPKLEAPTTPATRYILDTRRPRARRADRQPEAASSSPRPRSRR